MTLPAVSTRTSRPAPCIRPLMYSRPAMSALLNASRLTPPCGLAPNFASAAMRSSMRAEFATGNSGSDAAAAKVSRQVVKVAAALNRSRRKLMTISPGIPAAIIDCDRADSAGIHYHYAFFRRWSAMPVVTLPDGSRRTFDRPVSVAEVAADIGKGLARAALAGAVDGQLVDTAHLIESDATLRIITSKDREGLEILRHSTAHLLAQAVQSIYPKAQVTIGPVIEDGFYYDFAFERAFTPEDLERFESKM